jgi:hypothetical protein
MANSSIVGFAKNKIIKEFIKDQAIVDAIGCDKGDVGEKLVNTHIFNYNQNPNTMNDVQTFVTVQVHIPQSYGYNNNSSSIYVSPTIEIWIISHEKHMNVDNIPKVTENRNDYLARLIDEKLNGRDDIGLGKLTLVSNVEGSFQKDYLYRTLVFKATDLNNSLCSVE